MKHTKGYIIFLAVAVIMMLIPFVGMAFVRAEPSSAEKRELSPWPEFRKEAGGINIQYVSMMGDYFQDHFALRDDMIVANAKLKNATVKSAVQDEVLIGRDGWLFYSGTMKDYLGRELLSERELYAVTHNINLMRDYVEQRGSRFVFTIAPNKNTLYGQYMPVRYIRAADSNMQNLKSMLLDAGINYADVSEVLLGAEETMYFKRDSHWNNKGAALVFDTLMYAAGKEYDGYESMEWTERADHMGDIDEMLYLTDYQNETQYYPQKEIHYIYVNDVEDDMDEWIETQNPKKSGCVFMFRDSFGESLVPFFAEEYGQAYFSRLMPYNLADVEKTSPDIVILQKVERNLIDFAVRAPIMQAPTVENFDAVTVESESEIEASTDGPYYVVDGKVDMAHMRDDTELFICIQNKANDQRVTYLPFYLTNRERTGNECRMYIKKELMPQGEIVIQLITHNEDEQSIIESKTVQVTEEGFE